MEQMVRLFSEAAAPLLRWYDENRRDLPWRRTRDPYAVWISEIMLQQTRVAAVLPYYERWMQALPDVSSLAEVDDETLMKLWQGLGYYSRARNLKKAASVIMDEHGGQFPDTFDSLLSLPGVGEYTAGAVASIAFSRKVSAVDGNLLRIAARVCGIRENILDSGVKKRIRAALDEAVDENRPGEFNQALMDLGATVCLPNGAPRCGVCPLAHLCRARALSMQAELPVRARKATRRREQLTVFLMLRGGEVALRKRGDEGLLAGLWEFPNVSGDLSEHEAAAVLKEWGLVPLDWKKRIAAKHIFTHVEWHMTGYLLAVTGGDTAGLVWADGEKLRELAVPAAFKKYLEELKGILPCE